MASLKRGETETRFATTVGSGVKVLVNEHFGFRFEGRVWANTRLSRT